MLHENYWQHGNLLQHTCKCYWVPTITNRNNKENWRDFLPNKSFKRENRKQCLQMSSIFAIDARIPSPLSCSSGWPFIPSYWLVCPWVNLACCVLLNNLGKRLSSGSEAKWYRTPLVIEIKSPSQREWPYPTCIWSRCMFSSLTVPRPCLGDN